MSELDTLAQTFALGAANRPLPLDALPVPVQAALGDAPPPNAETLALDLAALLATAERAVPPVSQVEPIHLPPRSKPWLPDRVAVIIHRLCAERGLRPLLAKAMVEVAQRGWTLRPSLLLRVMGAIESTDRELVAGTFDERAQAVFATERGWGSAVAAQQVAGVEASDFDWDAASDEERVSFIDQLRTSDPRAAVTLLESGWSKHKAAQRQAFIYSLQINVSLDDEPFLEAALDDRVAAVRAAAQGTLAGLRSSALLGRAEAVLAAHVRVRNRALRRPLVECDPVEETPELIRNGVVDPQDGTAPGLARLDQLVSLVPSDRLAAVIGLDGVGLLDAKVTYNGSDYRFADALENNANRWDDAELAAALVQRDPTRLAGLAGLLPQADRAQRIRSAIQARDEGAMRTLVRWLPPQFDAELAIALTEFAVDPANVSGSLAERLVEMMPSRAPRAALPAVIAILERVELGAALSSVARLTTTYLQLDKALMDAIEEESR